MQYNHDTVTIPVSVYEELLQAHYFKRACESADIKKWKNYETVELLIQKFATEDINRDNTETE